MKFRSGQREEPEINLIPFIDILLVVVIFLMLSTTYSKFTQLQIQLPNANAQALRDYPKEVRVAVSADGHYVVNQTVVSGRGVEDIASAILESAKAGKDSMVVIQADANAAHQSVIAVLEAARRAGLSQITFAAQSSAAAR